MTLLANWGCLVCRADSPLPLLSKAPNEPTHPLHVSAHQVRGPAGLKRKERREPQDSTGGTGPPYQMRLFSSLLTFSLLHSDGLVSGRGEIGLDGDLYREIPRPTPEPLLFRDEFKHGAVLMETRLGYRRDETSRRNFALGARQVCDLP